MGTKVLPWLSSVERGVPPDEAASRPASLIGILKDSASDLLVDLVDQRRAHLAVRCAIVARTSGARSTGTAAVISPRYDTAPMQPAREDAFSSSTVMKLVAEQPVPAYADDSSIGDALDRQLHAGSGTDVSRGGRGMTPVSGTIPSAFYLQVRLACFRALHRWRLIAQCTADGPYQSRINLSPQAEEFAWLGNRPSEPEASPRPSAGPRADETARA